MGFYRCMPKPGIAPTFSKNGLYRSFMATGGGIDTYLNYFIASYGAAQSFTIYRQITGAATTQINYDGGNTFYNSTNRQALFIETEATNQIYLNSRCNNMFANAKNLTNFDFLAEFNMSLVENAQGMFDNCIYFNYNVYLPNASVLENAFAYCSNLNQNIYIAPGASLRNTFRNCILLNQNIQISEGCVGGLETFRGCTALNQNIQLPQSGTLFVNFFMNCTALNQNIRIPSNANNISQMFAGCTALNQNILFPATSNNCEGIFRGCTALNQNILFPDGVTTVSHAFSNCTSLNQNIKIPLLEETNPLTTSAYSGMFMGCTALNQNILIPDSTRTFIRNCINMFRNCTSMRGKNIVFGNTINLFTNTFMSCPKFDGDVWIRQTKNASINALNMFYGRDGTTRVNLHFNQNLLANFRGNTASNSITGTAITWTRDVTNGYYYNTTKNIYLYYNYTP